MAVRDRITALRTRQAEVQAEMENILTASESNESGDLTEEQTAAYDQLRAEDDRLTAGIERETDMERRRAAAARPIAPLPAGNSGGRATVPAQAEQQLEPGIKFSRLVQAVASTRGQGGMRAVLDFSEKTWGSAFAAAAADNMEQSVDVQGGFLVNTDYSNDLIAALRPQVAVRKMGAVSVPMPNGNLTFRKQTGTSNAQWLGERAAVPTSAPEIGEVAMKAKKLGALVPITNDLLRYNSIQTDNMVNSDVTLSVAIAEDQQFIRGAGSDFAPAGLRYLANASNVIAANATVNVQNVRNDLGKLRLALTKNNVPMQSPGYIINPTLVEFLSQLQTSTGALAFPEIADGRIGAYPYTSTTSVPDNLGTGGNQSELYFADFGQILIGDALQTTLAVSTQASYVDTAGITRSAFQNDETLVRVIEAVDLNTRYDNAIAVLTDAAWFPGAVAGQ
ncbi:phage major capsid protein [Acetobacter sp. DmW_136]|uniref:phage major capsid protein n=1 Tax=Acetobacter sp. DmW_136 TaxID=2591091 RepID=UPI00123923D8|nr:phage major capsid protein [Acetobacter sp. DmW_136]KAA8387762.1 phage major capsid protein [Acetobacter sp. DmW_136]